MPTHDPEETTETDNTGTIEARIDELESEISQLRDENEELRDRVDELEDDQTGRDESSGRIEWRGEGQHIEHLWIDGIPVGRMIANRRDEIDELADDVDAIEQDTTATEPESRVDDDYTPIERMTALGEDITESVSDRRALTLFENFSDWASRSPAGLVLKSGPDRVKTLLNTARDDDVISDWNQVYRAYERLEELSDGYIEYVEDERHGKMLIMEESMPSMQGDTESTPTASSLAD